jgi:eukaryotic-like serine/threonine-protein kinase
VETRITSDPDTEVAAVWLRDGSSVVYSVVRGSAPRLFSRDLATGREEALLPPGAFQMASDVSPDGKTLLYEQRTEGSNFTVWTLPVPGPAKPILIQQSRSNNLQARFSPDGRYIAFLSNDSGTYEVYVAPFPGPGERTRISAGGAQSPRWSSSGEILYLSDDRRMMSVPVRTAPSLQVGAPTALFPTPGKWSWVNFDVSPDGQKILAIVPEVVADELPLTAVVNWAPEPK